MLWWGCPYGSGVYDSPVFRPLDYIWMNIKDWWNDNWKKEPEIFRKMCFISTFAITNFMRNETWPPSWEAMLSTWALSSDTANSFFPHLILLLLSQLHVFLAAYSQISCLRFNLSDKVSRPYKLSCTIVVAYLIFTFLERSGEYKKSQTKQQQASYKLYLSLSPSCT